MTGLWWLLAVWVAVACAAAPFVGRLLARSRIRQETRDAVHHYLTRHRGKWLSSSDIAADLDLTASGTMVALVALDAAGVVTRRRVEWPSGRAAVTYQLPSKATA